MGQEQDTPAVGILVQRKTLAALTGAVQIAVPNHRHVAGLRHLRQRIGLGSCHGGE
jgi:hypothetical protein